MDYIIAFGGLILFLLLGMPVAFALGATAVVMLFLHSGDLQGTTQLAIAGFKAVDSFVLVALPLYVLMGESFTAGSSSQRLYRSATALTQHLRAGLGIATISSCGVFAAISGSSMTNAVTLGRITIPEMRARGYDKELAAGLVASGGTLGMLIPPSLAFILYSALTDTSVRALFAAGLVPGLLQLGLTILFLLLLARVPQPLPQVPWAERFVALTAAGWALALPIIVLGGIYGGVFTATEAAAVGAIYVIMVNILTDRRFEPRALWQTLLRTVENSARLLSIVIGSSLLGHAMIVMQIPQEITAAVVSFELAPPLILVGILLVLTLLGCFLDPISITLIAVPIVFPVVTAMGFDPIWFGVLLVMNLELGMITPPIGMNLFAIQSIVHDLRSSEMWRAALPFAGISVLSIAIVFMFPEVAMWLPGILK